MPKCQFLFSAVFGFRNPSKEIFSESDEINAQYPIFIGSFQNTRETPEGRPRGPTHGGGSGRFSVSWFCASGFSRRRLYIGEEAAQEG